MHPLVFFAIAALEREERSRDDAVIWRNRHARDATPAARRRDERWAAAIARRASASRDLRAVTKPPCDGVIA